MKALQDYIQERATAAVDWADFVRRLEDGPARLLLRTSKDGRYSVMFRDRDETAYTNVVEREAVGTVFDQDTHALCGASAPLMREYIFQPLCPADWDKISSNLPASLEDYECRVYTEGTRFFVYHHRGEWKASTCRVLALDEGRWYRGTRSFQEQFQDAVEAMRMDMNELNPDLCYTFILCSPENSAIIQYPKPFLFHVYTRNMKTGEYVHDAKVPRVHQSGIISVRSHKDLRDYLLSSASTVPGVILTHRVNGDCIKILSHGYHHLRELLGNRVSMVRRILELMNESPARLREFEEAFPHMKKLVHETRYRFRTLVDWLLFIYKERYVYRTAMAADPEELASYLPRPLHSFLVMLKRKYVETQRKYNPHAIQKELFALPLSRLEYLLEVAEEYWQELEMEAGLEPGGPKKSATHKKMPTVQKRKGSDRDRRGQGTSSAVRGGRGRLQSHMPAPRTLESFFPPM